MSKWVDKAIKVWAIILWSIFWIFIIISILAVSWYNDASEKEKKLLSSLETYSLERYCAYWVKDITSDTIWTIESIETFKVLEWRPDEDIAVHWVILLWWEKDFFCSREKDLNVKTRWWLTQLSIWWKMFYNK